MFCHFYNTYKRVLYRIYYLFERVLVIIRRQRNNNMRICFSTGNRHETTIEMRQQNIVFIYAYFRRRIWFYHISSNILRDFIFKFNFFLCFTIILTLVSNNCDLWIDKIIEINIWNFMKIFKYRFIYTDLEKM